MSISTETYEVLSTVSENLSILKRVLEEGKTHEALDIVDGLIEETDKLMVD